MAVHITFLTKSQLVYSDSHYKEIWETALEIACKLGLDRATDRYRICVAVREATFSNQLQLPAKTEFEERYKEVASLMIFWYMSLYVRDDRKNGAFFQVFDGLLSSRSEQKLEMLRLFFKKSDAPSPPLSELIFEHREFYKKMGLTSHSFMGDILSAFINEWVFPIDPVGEIVKNDTEVS